MEEIKKLLVQADKSIKTADHLAYVTYQLIRDTKLLNQIIRNVHQAILTYVDALLYYDYIFKRISVFPRDQEAKLEVFRNKSARYHNLGEEYIMFIRELTNVAKDLKNSPFGFVKKDKIVISNGTEIKTITFEMVKGYVNKSKLFASKINQIFVWDK